MDHDIDFSNQAFHSVLGFPNDVEFSSHTDLITNKFSPGTALFWIPSFVLAQGVSYLGSIVSNLLGIKTSVFAQGLHDGTGLVPQFFVAVSALSFSVLGLWFIYKFLLDWFEKKIALLVSLTIFLTTQIFYYTTADPVNSHSISFLLSSLLLYQFSRILKTKLTWQKNILIGITAGFLVLVRNQDFVLVLPVLLAILFVKHGSLLDKLNWLILSGGSAFIIFSIQIYTTIILFGFLGSPYLIRGEKLSWLHPSFFRVLFSEGNGLFFFAPITMISLFFLLKYSLGFIKEKAFVQGFKNNGFFSLAVVSIISFLFQLYVIACWGEEIIGGPYGSRMFISILPHLSLGTAFFIEFLLKKYKEKFRQGFISIISVFFINNVLQIILMLYRF